MYQLNLYTIKQIKESENIYIKKNSLNKLFDNATIKITNFIKKKLQEKKKFYLFVVLEIMEWTESYHIINYQKNMM